MSSWPKLVLFGDSLTQYSFQAGGWGAILADTLQRRGDVLNRGYSGYTTDYAVKILKMVFPPKFLQPDDVVTVFFGANDSSLPELNPIQHVPCERYASNLNVILKYISGLGISSQRILVISPPTVDEKAWEDYLVKESKGTAADRRNDVTRIYAKACEKVATENLCPCVSLWENMQTDDFQKYLCDGLHFSELGNKFTADLLLPHIRKLTESWAMNLPEWKEFDL